MSRYGRIRRFAHKIQCKIHFFKTTIKNTLYAQNTKTKGQEASEKSGDEDLLVYLIPRTIFIVKKTK